MQVKALPGFRDFYPEEFALRRHIADAWVAVAGRYGFEEYDGPPLEPLELYTAKSGDEIVDQLYRFTDKGGREVALRPEMTPTLARMVAARANGLKKPIRWFSMPQLFRYERQQRGRLREHFQLNCDLIGEPGPLGDAEIMALAIDVMRELGLTERDVRVRVSDRRLLTVLLSELGLEERHHGLAYQLLDKQGRGESAAIQAAAAAAGMPAEFIARLESLKDIRSFADLEGSYPLAAGAGHPLAQAFQALESMGLGGFLDLDLTIVRGLAYYTGTVFELFDAGYSLRAICGGGRYDNLLKALGGVDLPALGFGMGDVVLSELLRERQLAPSYSERLDVLLAAVTDADHPFLPGLAHVLRDAGARVEYPLAPSNLGKQLKLANARGARFAVLVGPDDRARGEVILKDLATGAQHSLPQAQLAAHLAALLGAAPSSPAPTT
ncbi:MAG: Histidyl-tRNA synthetase [Gemmatimonadetes bacterium]|nr:Histidyl-tRNA synthetase [Gemmatimonadota bacterium]